MGVQEEGIVFRHLGHLHVQSNKADLLTGCHTASALHWASWTRGRSLRSSFRACGQGGVG